MTQSHQLIAPFFAACSILSLTGAHAAHAQSISFGGLTIPLPKGMPKVPSAASTAVPPTAGNPTYGPTRAEMAQRDNVSAKVKEVTSNAEAAERIVHYGLDNELPDRSDIKLAQFLMRKVKACVDGVAALKASEPGAILYLNGYDGLGVGEVESRFCRPAMAQLEPIVGASVRAYEARWAGLSAERRQLVEMHGLSAYTIYGHGKRVLATPAQLQSSNVWYVWDEEKGYLMPHWWMATIRWTGNSYTKTVAKGAGTSPPNGLFR